MAFFWLEGFSLRTRLRGAARPTTDDRIASVKAPILVWLRAESDTSIAEAYGFPELYSHGDSKEEALQNLLILMDGFHQDFGAGGGLSDRLSEVSGFLSDVFE